MELKQKIEELKDVIGGGEGTTPSLNDLISQLNDKVDTTNTKIGDESTYGTVLKNLSDTINRLDALNTKLGDEDTLSSVLGKLGTTTKEGTLLYILEDLRTNRIGNIDTPDTLNYLINFLNFLMSKQLTYSIIWVGSTSREITYSPYLMDILNSDGDLVILADILNAPNLTIAITDVGFTTDKAITTITLTYALDIKEGEPSIEDITIIGDRNNKFYLLYFTSDLTNTPLVIEEYSVDANYNVTKVQTIVTNVYRTAGNKEALWGGAYLNNKLYVTLVNGKSGISIIDLSNGQQEAFYQYLNINYIRGDGEYLYEFSSNGANVNKYDDDMRLITTMTCDSSSADAILSSDYCLAIFNDSILIVLREQPQTFNRLIMTMKTPSWFVNSTKTTDDIVSKLDSIAGNVGITNFPSWFTSSTKTTDDVINTLGNELTRLAKLKAYNSGNSTWEDVPIEAFNNLKNNLDTTLSSIKSSIESQLPRQLYGYDGTNWVAIKTTSDGKLVCVLG